MKPNIPQSLIDHVCEASNFELVRCDESWGGTYGWTTTGSGSSVLGYKTERAAKAGFFHDRFGGREAGNFILNVVKKLESENCRLRKRLEKLTAKPA